MCCGGDNGEHLPGQTDAEMLIQQCDTICGKSFEGTCRPLSEMQFSASERSSHPTDASRYMRPTMDVKLEQPLRISR